MADLFNVFVTAANSSPTQATTTQSPLTPVDPKNQIVIPQESFNSVLTRVVNTTASNTSSATATTTTGTTTTATPTTSASTAAATATTTTAGTATASTNVAGNASQSAVLNQVLLSGGLLAQAGLIVSPVPGLGVEVTQTPTPAAAAGSGINATTTSSLTGDGNAAAEAAATTGTASRSFQLQSLLKTSPARTTAITSSITSSQADSKASTAANPNASVPLSNDPTVVPTAVNPTAAQALVAASLPTAKTSSIPAQIPLPNVGVVAFDPAPITVNTTQVAEPGAAPGVPSSALATGGQPNLGKDGAQLLSEAANQAASRIVNAPPSNGPTFQNTLTETLSNPVSTGTSAADTVNNAVPAPVTSDAIPVTTSTAASTTITAPTPNTPVAMPVLTAPAASTPVQPSTGTPQIAPVQAGTTAAVIAPLAVNPAPVGESKSANISGTNAGGTVAPSQISLPNANTILPTAVPASTSVATPGPTVAFSPTIPVNANTASITVTPPQPAALPTSLAGPPAAIAAPVNGTMIAGTTTLATNLTLTIGGPTIGGLTTGGEWPQKIDDSRDASKDVNPLASPSIATTTLAPAATDSPSTAPAPVSAQIADQVATQITHLGKDGTVEFRMRLDPPDLGPVKLHLVSSGGELRAEVTVTDNAVKQLIESQLPELRQRLEQSGVNIQRFDVSTDLGAGFGSGGNRGGQTGQQQMANPYPSWSPRAIESNPGVRVASTERGGNRLDVTV